MKAISLYQPWATLVAIGKKTYETRSWSTFYRGPIAIHASARWDRELAATCRTQPFMSVLFNAGYRVQDGWLGFKGTVDDYGLPLGCIVGVARLAVCRPMSDDSGFIHKWVTCLDDTERCFGDYSAGRFGFRLDDARRLAKPIPLKGRMKIWELDAEVAGEVWSRYR
jgi:activating signal cointegrator 1